MPLEMPLALNPAPVTVTPEIVTFELPLLVIDVVSELLLPSLTLPKDKLVGLDPSKKVAADPVPDKLIVVGELVALLVMVTLAPLTAPAIVGANITIRVADCPGVS